MFLFAVFVLVFVRAGVSRQARLKTVAAFCFVLCSTAFVFVFVFVFVLYSYEAGDSVDDAVKAAQQADVSIVFIGTTSSEGGDRSSLDFGDLDAVVEGVAQVAQANTTKKVWAWA